MSTRLVAVALSATLGFAGVLWAQQDLQQQQDPQQDRDPDIVLRTDEDPEQQRDRDQLDETSLRQTKPLIHRASALMDLEVQNRSGEELGNIEDLTVSNEGKVEYAAISFGGFVGIGDKLFAVPWSEIELRKGSGGDEWVAIVDITEQTLENAQGFNEDNWPDMANEQWRMQNDRAFRTTQQAQDRDLATPPRR